MKHLFMRKSIAQLHAEMEGDNRLRRILGPVRLTSLGIGCVIGAGIFVITGQAAHDKAGPAIMVSFAVAGLACVFAALSECSGSRSSCLSASSASSPYVRIKSKKFSVSPRSPWNVNFLPLNSM